MDHSSGNNSQPAGGADMPSLKSLLQLKKKYDAPAASELPPAYRANTDKEKLYIWAAENYESQIRQKFPHLKPLCLICKNECGVQKFIATFIKPTVLPYAHLFDIDACAQFVSDYIFYTPSKPIAVPTLASPTFTLATQLGNSLEMSQVLVSYLSGFGYQAFVVCGWSDKRTSAMDRTKEFCALLKDEEERASVSEDVSERKYIAADPPVLRSKYLEFLESAGVEAGLDCNSSSERKSLLSDRRASIMSRSTILGGESEEAAERKRKEEEEERVEVFHCWVYVHIPEAAFFLEATTGERKSLQDRCYKRVNSLWNAENYWLSKNDKWRERSHLDLHSNENWVKFVADLQMAPAAARGQQPQAPKRLLSDPSGWLKELQVPKDSFELMFRLGQKVQHYDRVRVEYYAPYLLKEATVQKVLIFNEPYDPEASEMPNPIHITEKFRFRTDKMCERESFPEDNRRVIERFSPGRPDQLREHEFYRLSSNHPMEYVSKFYSASRPDGLGVRVTKDLEMVEQYQGRMDSLQVMRVSFGPSEKKFGPAEAAGGGSGRGQREISRIVERFGTGEEVGAANDEEAESNDLDGSVRTENLGRILDTSKIMERIFDLDSERILLKFQRVGGQIFCKTVEFLFSGAGESGGLHHHHHQPDGSGGVGGPVAVAATAAAAAAAPPTIAATALGVEVRKLSPEDVKVYMVDPRQERPCHTELETIFQEQLRFQDLAVKRVAEIEKETNKLLEDRMKELSANDMDVWIYDTKRNQQVKKGRQEQEKKAQRKEENVLDLELDYLAPHLEKYSDQESLSKLQAAEVRDDCLQSIQYGLKEKEHELEEQLSHVKLDMAANAAFMTNEDMNSKKFLLNVLETRLKRQRRHTTETFKKAEAKVNADTRIKKFLH